MSALVQILAAGEPAQPSAPSQYMASVRVEIAFNAGQRTAASLRTWTDVSDYVELAEGITITWGRQDERSTADANQLTLTLDNSDGRFTFGKTSGPYGSGVKLDRPIRVILDPVDGTEAVYFLGFVNEWPTEWNGTDAYAKATITASSRLSRLGLRAALRSLIEIEIMGDSPVAYYTLGEPSGATQANDLSGNRAPSLTIEGTGTAVTFGSATGPGTDSLTAAQFAGGEYLAADLNVDTALGFTVECFVLRDGSPASTERFMRLTSSGSTVLSLGINTSGQVFANAPIASAVTTTSSFADGQTHHVLAGISAIGGLDLYVDGVSQGSDSDIAPADIDQIAVGSDPASAGFTGVVAHVAVYDSKLPFTPSTHSDAGLTGFAGETTDARLARYAALAAIPVAELSAEAGQTTVQHVDSTGKQVVELMRIMETAENGVLFDALDGTLTFHNRAHRYVVSSAFTLNMAEQEVEADYLPKADRAGLANDVTVKDVSGRYEAHVVDDASVDAYGLATLSIETASEDDEAPANLGGWTLYKYKDPKERAPSLSVDALAQVGKTPNCAAVLAATVGTKITVSNRPTQAATSSVDYFVEGGTIQIGPELLRVTWNLSPSSPEDQALMIGDATRGVIGTNPIAF